MKAKTKSGFECEVNADALNDMEVLDLLCEMQDGNALVMGKLVTKLLGKDGRAALYEHYRKEDGRVPTEDVGNAISEIFNSFAAGKNS